MASIWQVQIILGGVDRSALMVGQARVQAEESTARIATFNLKTPSGTVTPGDWLGVPVSIDYQSVDSVGTVLSQERLFTGIVDQAYYNLQTGLTEFRCTDDMQAKFEAMDQTTIDGLISGARWSDSVFGESADGWQYLSQLLETIPASVEYNRDGTTLAQTDWAAKAVADFSYSATEIFDGSIEYSIAPRRDLVNVITIDYGHRFTRLKHREHGFEWSIYTAFGSGWFCGTYFIDSHELPNSQMIGDAAAGNGWSVKSVVTYGRLIASAADPCNIGVAWSISDQLRETLATTASWTGIKRWTQQATEIYTLTVQAPQSVTWLGTVAKKDSSARDVDYNAEGWEAGTETPTDPAVRVDAHGDYVIDKLTRADADNDIETVIARGRVEILASHRANYVSGRVAIEPTLERSHTVAINAGGVDAKGKIYSFEHLLDADRGEASTLIRIALSQNGNQAAIADDAIAAPVPPNSDPAIGPPSTSTTLDTHIGGKTGAPVYDATWTGFTGNYTIQDAGAETYPRRFSAPGPDVNQEAVDAVEGTAVQTYNFNVPNDTLIIAVP